MSNVMQKGAKQLSAIFIGVLIMLVGSIVLSVLFYGIIKADKVEASHLVFKDQVIQLIGSYKDYTIKNLNSMNMIMSKNTYYIETLNKFIEIQEKNDSDQNKKIDRIIQDLRDVNRTVLVTMTKLEMQGTQTIKIEEG